MNLALNPNQEAQLCPHRAWPLCGLSHGSREGLCWRVAASIILPVSETWIHSWSESSTGDQGSLSVQREEAHGLPRNKTKRSETQVGSGRGHSHIGARSKVKGFVILKILCQPLRWYPGPACFLNGMGQLPTQGQRCHPSQEQQMPLGSDRSRDLSIWS